MFAPSHVVRSLVGFAIEWIVAATIVLLRHTDVCRRHALAAARGFVVSLVLPFSSLVLVHEGREMHGSCALRIPGLGS